MKHTAKWTHISGITVEIRGMKILLISDGNMCTGGSGFLCIVLCMFENDCETPVNFGSQNLMNIQISNKMVCCKFSLMLLMCVKLLVNKIVKVAIFIKTLQRLHSRGSLRCYSIVFIMYSASLVLTGLVLTV